MSLRYQVRWERCKIAAGDQCSNPYFSDKILDSAIIREFNVCHYASCYLLGKQNLAHRDTQSMFIE